MTSPSLHQAKPESASDRLTDAVTQAEMLCSIEGEQSEVCKLAKAYVEALRSEATSQSSPLEISER